MLLLPFLFLKFAAYFGVLLVAAKMFDVERREMMTFALKWASIKLLLGVPFGIAILIVHGIAESVSIPGYVTYLIAFGGVRIIEWICVYRFISFKHTIKLRSWLKAWIGLGVITSMLTDLLLKLFKLDSLKFFC